MKRLVPVAFAAALVGLFFLARSRAQDARAEQQPSPQAEEAYRDIQAQLGVVPAFLKAFPQESIAGAWAEMKAVQLSKTTALNGRVKELIGMAVAAQIPCRYCSYFHESAAKVNGATDQQVREAVGVAALTRNFATLLNGRMTEETAFRRDVDRMAAYYGRTARAPKGEAGMREAPAGQETAASDVPAGKATTQDVHREIERTFGFVPGFFKDVSDPALAGLWSETRRLEFNPNTGLSAKEKDLIGLAVSAQVPDRYGIYYFTKGARMNGATEVELKEALAVGGLTRHWSTVLNGLRLDERQFQRETDQIMERMRQEKGAPGK